MTSLPDYYALLGTTPDATQRQIKTAYRKRMKEAHPDLAGYEDATEKHRREVLAKQINEAYTVLSDPMQRRRYDRNRRSSNAARPSASEPLMANMLRSLLR